MEPLAESVQIHISSTEEKSSYKKDKIKEQIIEDVAKEIIKGLPKDLSSKDEVYTAVVSYLKKEQAQKVSNTEDEAITIENTINSSTGASKPPNLPDSKKITTVAELIKKNSHIAAIPKYALKDQNAEISQKDIQRHTLAQGLLYLGVPASTLPMLANNPRNFGIGLGIGAACGALIAMISTAKRNSKGEAFDWLERSVAVTNIYKAAVGGIQAIGIAGNFIATVIPSDSELFPIFEGGVAGAIIGYEGVDALLNQVQKYTEAQSTQKNNINEKSNLPDAKAEEAI